MLALCCVVSAADQALRVRLHCCTGSPLEVRPEHCHIWLQGRGQFVSSRQVEVNGQLLEFAAAVVATGGAAAVPSVPGLTDCG